MLDSGDDELQQLDPQLAASNAGKRALTARIVEDVLWGLQLGPNDGVGTDIQRQHREAEEPSSDVAVPLIERFAGQHLHESRLARATRSHEDDVVLRRERFEL